MERDFETKPCVWAETSHGQRLHRPHGLLAARLAERTALGLWPAAGPTGLGQCQENHCVPVSAVERRQPHRAATAMGRTPAEA
jgi:hypothetical protein